MQELEVLEQLLFGLLTSFSTVIRRILRSRLSNSAQQQRRTSNNVEQQVQLLILAQLQGIQRHASYDREVAVDLPHLLEGKRWGQTTHSPCSTVLSVVTRMPDESF